MNTSCKMAFFDTHNFERQIFDQFKALYNVDITYYDLRLSPETASLAQGHHVVCPFVNDQVNEKALTILKKLGIKGLALRSAGFNHVDVAAAKKLSIPVARVPEYSPYSVAEHAVALILTLNRHTHRAYQRIREMNFSLEGLMGFDLHGKTIGIIGTGKIGTAFAKIMHGFGCKLVAFDITPNDALIKSTQCQYVDINTLYQQSDIISLHVPLNPQTKHMINQAAFSKMKPNAMLINTSRGGLVDTKALIQALKKKQISAAGLDVYEEESGIFFSDFSDIGLQDDQLARLLTFPNVFITSHQGFLTQEALTNIAQTTLLNAQSFFSDVAAPNANLIS